jgi:outer membrane protein assembly factor BamD
MRHARRDVAVMMVGRRFLGVVLVIAALASCSSNPEVREVTPQDLLARAETQLEKGKHQQAIDELTQLSIDHPGVAFIDRVVFRLGEAYLGAEFFAEAEAQFARVIRDYPFSEFSDDASYLAAESFYLQRGGVGNDASMSRAALSRFRLYLREYPDGPLAPRARARVQEIRELLALKKLRAGEQYLRHRRFESARIYAELVLDEYPDTVVVPRAWMLLARASMKLDDPEQACRAMESLSRLPAAEVGEEIGDKAASLAGELDCTEIAARAEASEDEE